MAYVISQKRSKDHANVYGSLDEIGSRYLVPVVALKRAKIFPLKTNEQFLYYQPSEKGAGKCYFGSGRIASVEVKEELCWITFNDYAAFELQVPHRNGETYLETQSTSQPMFVASVRHVPDQIALKIIDLGAKSKSPGN